MNCKCKTENRMSVRLFVRLTDCLYDSYFAIVSASVCVSSLSNTDGLLTVAAKAYNAWNARSQEEAASKWYLWTTCLQHNAAVGSVLYGFMSTANAALPLLRVGHTHTHTQINAIRFSSVAELFAAVLVILLQPASSTNPWDSFVFLLPCIVFRC